MGKREVDHTGGREAESSFSDTESSSSQVFAFNYEVDQCMGRSGDTSQRYAYVIQEMFDVGAGVAETGFESQL